MKKYFIESYNFLTEREKKKLVFFFFLTCGSTFFETLSIGALYPLFTALISENSNDKIPFFEKLFDLLNFSYSPNNLVLYASVFVLFIFITKNIFLIYFLFWYSNFYKALRLRVKSNLLKYYINETYLFQISNNSSNLVRNISLTADQAITNVYNCMVLIIETAVFLGLIIFLFFIQGKILIFLILAIGIPTIIFAPIIKKTVGRWGGLIVSFQGKAMKAILQSFSMFKELKIFSKEEKFLNFYFIEENQVQDYLKKTTILKGIPRFFFETLILIAIIAYIYSSYSISSSGFVSLIPELGILTVTALRIYPSVNKIIFSINKLSQNYKALQIVGRDLNNMKDETADDKKIEFVEEIQFKNVSFKYPNKSESILNDLNLSIKKGEYIGICGSSGSGKSTFLDLLLGLFTPTDGEIIIDGKIFSINSKSWRNKIGYVPQNVNLLDDNILANISLDNEISNLNLNYFNEIINSCVLAEFINQLPNGNKTNLGERGSRISGGEKQRIGIARALYRNPEILILDESTNSIDLKTKKTILKNINNLRGEKTIISISHEMDVLKDCDKIFEMKNGKLVQV